MTAPLDSLIVAQYLTEHPAFFDEYASLLGDLKLSSPLTGRTLSLQERQMEVMREKYKALELQLTELKRLAAENERIANKFHQWTRVLLESEDIGSLPHAVADGIRNCFGVPQVTLKIWNTAPIYADEWFVRGASEDARLFANSLHTPYCGDNKDFEAATWLSEPEQVNSTVIIALRRPGIKGASAFGLLVLGSSDPARFTSMMGTDFLAHIGETAATALVPLLA